MFDLLPFPNISGSSLEEVVFQVNNYLLQFKEALEFSLTNISTENLSQEVISILNQLNNDIGRSVEERDDQLQQVVNNEISVFDVINSQSFKAALDNATSKVNFSVNFSTGNLEYTTS